jgi:hypothetical protein
LQRFIPHLLSLAKDPTPLESWCSSRQNQKLGRYFETLISYWLHHSPGIVDVRQSLQVMHNHLTLGEFDFLFYDQMTQQHYHLEVAIKFYLQYGSGLALSDYIGPSGTDRLDRKVLLLFEKQLSLGSTEPGARLLQMVLGQSHVTPLAFVKGMIFVPADKETEVDRALAPGISPQCLRGSWLTQSTLTGVLSGESPLRWRPVPRLHWLSPVIASGPHDALTDEAMRRTVEHHFATSSDPIMLAMLKYDHATQVWGEQGRVFVLKEAPLS